MESFYFIILLALTTFLYSSGAENVLRSELCRPHPTLLSIDSPNYQLYPYIIKLHRCGGTCANVPPTVQKCVVKKTEHVVATVFDVGRSKVKVMKLLNHTECGCECVAKPSDCTKTQSFHHDSCECRCKYPDTPPEPCPEGFLWSGAECACICHRPPEVCPVGKTWNTRQCGCTCHRETISKCKRLGLNVDDKCKCTSVEVGANTGQDPQGNPKLSKFTLLLMAGEFVLMCIIFDAILCRWKAGFTYSVIQKLKCKGRSKDIKTAESSMGKDNSTEFSSVSAKESAEQV